MKNYQIEFDKWLASDKLSPEERAELLSIRDDEETKELRFGAPMDFGTAGLRSTMYMGIGCMNRFTVAHTTRGIAALIKAEGGESRGVAIAYDSRNHSEEFARVSACVLAGAGIKSYIFNGLRPTPELSYAVRETGALAGINITASHNPKQYNGYKAYWEDGAQLPPEHADTVSAEMEALDIFADVKLADFDKALSDGLIVMLGAETDEKYLAQVVAQAVNPDAVKAVSDDLAIVYTPLHGTGHKLVPEVMRRIGLKNLYTVPEQMIIDGNFPTVPKPNPEYPQVFELGIEIANRVGSDLIVATDPDADRVGVMTRTADGSFMTITGNQMGALLLDYILTAYEETGSMPDHPYAVKTIVSTELAAAICAAHNVTMHNVLTGFKFIGEVIKNYEAKGYGSFILGFEESYGYLKGTYARDKDAVVASMLICEMTAYYKAKNMTLGDALQGLYARYGYCYETNVEIYMEGLDGAARMAAMMDTLRNDPPATFGDVPVELFGDYKTETFTELATGKKTPTGLPKSNVLYFKLTNGDVIVVRPSGTEPKIKFYFLLLGKDKDEVLAKLEGYKKTLEA